MNSTNIYIDEIVKNDLRASFNEGKELICRTDLLRIISKEKGYINNHDYFVKGTYVISMNKCEILE